MSDAYRRYGDSRQQQPTPPISSLVGKRPRSDFDVHGGREPPSYFPHDDDHVTRVIRDSDTINTSYDRYLRSGISSYSGVEVGRLVSGGISTLPVDDPRIGSDPRIGGDPRLAFDPRAASDLLIASDPRIANVAGLDPSIAVKGRTASLGSGRPEVSLPPDASSTLFVEGLPANCTRREVAHIFRPFVGYKEVRLVIKESRHSGGDPIVLCFVDFLTPAHAATAMDALQGELIWGSQACLLTLGLHGDLLSLCDLMNTSLF
ncbi:hypothetical protein Ancab_009032 [Ancistrocladus abbreviatus]